MMTPIVNGYGEVEGYVMGDPTLEGARHPLAALHGRRNIAVHPPKWRQPGHAPIAPGVPAPGEGRQTLPLTPDIQNGVFTAAADRITFSARPQTPFKGERPLITVVKTSGAAAIVKCALFAVGKFPQQVELGAFSIEPYGAQGLDLNWAMTQAEPGVLIQMQLFLVGTLAAPDTITVDIQILGREVH